MPYPNRGSHPTTKENRNYAADGPLPAAGAATATRKRVPGCEGRVEDWDGPHPAALRRGTPRPTAEGAPAGEGMDGGVSAMGGG